ncbi:kinesin motor domain-containing protein [Choanephora cucurbitarum]|nr:kinesin motor domain-containing protein [Choanephora cucurbitarum]
MNRHELSLRKHTTNRQKKPLRQLNDTQRYKSYDPEKEPLKAYLRIRPKFESHQGQTETPYIDVLDNYEVVMTPPENTYRTRHKTPERYRFTRVFREEIDQQTFFNETCLELVKDTLHGKNALIFAYGVTNSGKTFTMLGKEGSQAGLLPRTMNTIFSSIQHYQGNIKVKPVMHNSLQPYDDDMEENRHLYIRLQEEVDTEDSDMPDQEIQQDVEEEIEIPKIDIDPDFQYAVWISFVEIYNEQLFDLFLPPQTKSKQQKRQPLPLKYDQHTGHKYIGDTHLVRVYTAKQAETMIKLGQKNRQVFSTLMNQSSSRSHSVFTVYLVRYSAHAPEYATLSKLSLVDLAGSERYRNTNSTGQRLKEAGNINKSLMVLGQCMEVLRMNQVKMEMGKAPSLVPFRHSKLTELFKSSFEGDGKAAIIVNVNPVDTGFDENNHVMKFAAVAKDVMTWSQPKLQHALDVPKHILTSSLPIASDDEEEEGDDDEALTDHMIHQLEELWNKWLDAESRATRAEHDIRMQVTKEMEVEMKRMEDLYFATLKKEAIVISEQENNQIESTTLLEFQEKQYRMAKELDHLKIKLRKQEVMQTRIIQLEQHKAQGLLLESSSSNLPGSEDEDEANSTDQAGNSESYQTFLSLRKQLRKSIFKKEELCEDADHIMKQVEQFKDVTFQLAKETKMGKLLKLIAQEEFEKDPYQIRNRAIRLFKRYAQLPSNTPSLSPSPTTSPTPPLIESVSRKDTIDLDNVLAENARLKQRIKVLCHGQKRLKGVFERLQTISPSMVEDDDRKENEVIYAWTVYF